MSKLPRPQSGVAITGQLAERLADEAEAGDELSAAKRVGRKSLARSGGASPRVNFRMPAKLQARAEHEGKTVSQIAREALEQYVE